MSYKHLTQDSIAEQLNCQLRSRISGWAYLIIPLLFSCVIILLWVLMLVFGGKLAPEPAPLIFSAAILTAGLLISIAAYRHFISITIHKNPLLQQVPVALEYIQQAIVTSSERSDIISVVHDQIQQLLNPTYLDTALYDHGANAFTFTESGKSLPTDDAFIIWLASQPINIPIHLPVTGLVVEAQETQKRLLDWEIQTILPLGNQAWLGIGKPEGKLTYSSAQCSAMQYLSQPVGVGLERTALIEIQKERAEELQAIYWITQAANFSVGLDDLLELIYTQLKRVIQLPNFVIALINPDTGDLTPTFYIKDNVRLNPEKIRTKTEGLADILLKHKMTIRTSDYLTECQRRGIEPAEYEQDTHAWVGTALTAGDKNIGVMVASHTDPNKLFSEEDQNFFITIASYTSSILDRKTLHEQLQLRAQQLNSLVGIGRLLASSLDLNVVLDLVVENAAYLLNSVAGSLLLLDEKSGDLIFRSSSGPTGAILLGMRIPAGKGIAGAAFTENKPIISQDTQNDGRWYGNIDESSEFVTQSIIAVPLNTRGRTIGVLEVINRKDARSFDTEDSDLLLSFASQAAIAIENARLFTTTDQALQARLEELMTIQYIDRQLNATLDYHKVMDQTLEWAIRITHATIGAICALNETDEGVQGLRFLAHKGYAVEDFELYNKKQLWPLDKGLLGYTVTLGKTFLEKAVKNSPYYAEFVPGMEAQLTVPIKREGRVIGAIALESEEPECFTEENVAFIQRLADHAAIAIENARLFQQVQQANEAKTQFVSFVSHELKQPLTSLRGYSELLAKDADGPLSEKQLRFVNIIHTSFDRMDRLVQDLLDISRIESGQMRMEMGPIVPDEIVSEAVQAFQQKVIGKKQILHVDITPNLPVITGDRGRLIQVLTNLVSNAHKYTPEGGVISVRVAPLSDKGRECICWSVQDSGIGLSREELDKLFTKYFRAGRTVVRSIPGTGLGLVISRSIVELHGGSIAVESTYHKGSIFSFTIPILQP